MARGGTALTSLLDLPWGGTTYGRMGPPTLVINQEIAHMEPFIKINQIFKRFHQQYKRQKDKELFNMKMEFRGLKPEKKQLEITGLLVY